MFVIAGTSFMTKISYDFIMMTKSIAKESIRASWSDDCTDAGLESLVQGGSSKDIDKHNAGEQAKQDGLRVKAKEILAQYMLRWDENSFIHGHRVMIDYFAFCKIYKDALMPTDNSIELRHRESLYHVH